MYPYYYVNKPSYYPYYYNYPTIPNNQLPSTEFRNFPPVNPNIFMSSAKHMQALMLDASKLLEKMASNRKFSFDLMSAAQQSNKNKVQELIRLTGIKSAPNVGYSPDGLKLIFVANADQSDCCHLTLNLRWF